MEDSWPIIMPGGILVGGRLFVSCVAASRHTNRYSLDRSSLRRSTSLAKSALSCQTASCIGRR